MPTADAIQALMPLGFTALEAEAYTWLLGEPGATGYRIAKGIGKPVANTYKALASLQKKGAVLVDEDENRVCRAVPAEELLHQLERGFASNRAGAARALSRVAGPEGDDRVYTLRTAAQVMERARSMLRMSRQVVLIDAFPGALAALRSDIARAVGRGVDIAVKTYRRGDAGGAETFVEPNGEGVLARWSGEWLNLVVDGAEHLLAFFDAGLTEVRQAIWSGSPYLSWVYHSALAAELVMAEVQALAHRTGRRDRLRKLMDRFDALVAPDATGYRALMKRFSKKEKQK
jgi:HTH-type transcriptional regulator, sugar sensing transcriptional regulator